MSGFEKLVAFHELGPPPQSLSAELALQNLDFDHCAKKVHLGAFQRQLRPRRVDGNAQQVARCVTVHSAGSQLPLRVLGMYLCCAPETTRRR